MNGIAAHRIATLEEAWRALRHRSASFSPRTCAGYVIAAWAGSAWGEALASLALTPLLFVAWWRAPTRAHAWACATTYHVMAARSLIVGGANFFLVSKVTSLTWVLCGAGIASAPWALCWSGADRGGSQRSSFLRVVGVLALSALPPLAAFSVTSPLLAAGVWFPATGFAGLGALALLGCLMRAGTQSKAALRWWGAVGAWCVVCALVMFVGEHWRLIEPAPSIAALTTHIESAPSDGDDFVQQWRVAEHTLGLAARETAALVVTPEASGGVWQPAMERRWKAFGQRLEREQRSAVVGATFLRQEGQRAAGAVLLGAGDGPRTYRQRVPMPLAMWRPGFGAASHFEANWWGHGTLRVRGNRVGVLVCWEIGTPWAALGSIVEGADSLVGLANTGWLRETSANAAERQALAAWGQLFDLPVALAMNE